VVRRADLLHIFDPAAVWIDAEPNAAVFTGVTGLKNRRRLEGARDCADAVDPRITAIAVHAAPLCADPRTHRKTDGPRQLPIGGATNVVNSGVLSNVLCPG
jgi:hypothetical protein